MGSIFGKPESNNVENFSQKVLFLHGLEGSPSGSKSSYLKKNWGALCPPLRTENIRELSKKKGNKPWSSLDHGKIEEALEPCISDALDAINYCQPDVIIGSSMGGAILAKLILDGNIDPGNYSLVFLAPAIKELIQTSTLPKLINSVWVLGETDTVVENKSNVALCNKSQGNLIFSPRDGHRLSIALDTGLIDAAILTSIELRY